MDMPPDGDAKPLYRYRFGSAEFDEMRFELRVGGVAVEVQNRPLQLLRLLLQHADAVVGHAQIDKALWAERITRQATAANVIANAVLKLRAALGEENARLIVAVPRQGYRLAGPVDKEAVGVQGSARPALAEGLAVPGRAFVLERLLARSFHAEAWRARHAQTGEARIYKFATAPEGVSALKREVTVYRLLRATLGERDDLVRVLGWNVEAPPFFLECEDAGPDLAAWAAEGGRLAALPAEARLALFLQLADAVEAAHGVPVLHRDLKPGNVFVDARAGTPRLRLGDFGSAALLEPEQLEALQITRMGLTLPPGARDALSGTALYLAPEVVAGAEPTLRSDQYALGVVLYQLMAGDCRRPMASGWQRDIADPLIAEDIARATDTDPALRFDSVGQLATQLRAIAQRREAAAEAARRAAADAALARTRARRPWVAGLVGVLSLALGTSLWFFAAERRSAGALARQTQALSALNQVLVDDLIGAANPAAAGRADISVAAALSKAAEGVARRFAGADPALRAGLHLAMQRALAELSRHQEAAAQGRLALAAWAELPATPLADVQDCRLRLAVDLVQLSQLGEAAQVLNDAEAAAGPAAAQAPEFRSRLLFAKSWVTGGDMAFEASTAQLREAWALARPLPPARAPWREKIAFALADNLTLIGRFAEGEALYRELLAAQQAQYGAGHARVLVTRVGLGNNLAAQDRLAEAAALLAPTGRALAEVLGPGHRMTLSAADTLATVQFKQGRYDEAFAGWSRVHEGFAALMGRESSYALTVQTNLALARLYGGLAAEAETLLRSALALARRSLADDKPQVQQIRYWLADALLDRGQAREAAALLEGLDAAALQNAEQNPHWPGRIAWQRARSLLALGRRSEAAPWLERAAADFAQAPAGDARANAALVAGALTLAAR